MKVMFRFFMLIALVGISAASFAQGVTTGGISGVVTDEAGVGLPGATVLAVHEPSGTRYGTSTLTDGRFTILGMRVGGPYTVTVSFVGYESQTAQNVQVTLGGTADLLFTLRDASALLEEVLVMGVRDPVFNSKRTGASTSISREAISSLPSINRRIGDFTRLTPQSKGNSFVGADNRFNNITVDGSYFNNSFGLAGQPGERTNVAPISMDAIEEISINIAPFDVRQANFVGAGVNTVTKSGTNQFRGTAFFNLRNQNFVGKKAGDIAYDPGTFDFQEMGISFGGPIIKNKLFFFASFEQEGITEPGTNWKANTGGQPIEGLTTRVLASDLNALSTYLRSNFDYETGPYQGYSHETPAVRLLAKIDYNINDRNKFSLRFNYLDSKTDVLLSNSNSLGAGNRRTRSTALNFQNSNYQIMENIRSVVGELNSRIGDNMANNLIIGYTYHDESRDSRGTMFPMVDILEGGSVYTTFGFEPFTPNNELRYSSFQLQNNFTIFAGKNTLTFGLSAERYESENIFFDGSQSVYVYNSLADWYADANGYLANPNRTVAPVTLNRFQLRYAAQPGVDIPIQPLKVFYTGVYGQNEWQATTNLKVTGGLRIDIPFFEDTGLRNTEVESFLFRNEKGEVVRYRTDKLPDPKIHWSPRLGFNWDVNGDRTTQLRGGTGIFTGKPAYVWISNQVGNNGVLTGFINVTNTTAYPFNPNPTHYKPTITTAQPAPSYTLALTDPDFKFPQIWRSNIALDQKLPLGLIGTVEAIYNRDINGIFYTNENLPTPTTTFAGEDRARYTSNRINSKIAEAIVLKNQNVGYAYSLSGTIERPFKNGLYAKLGYNYGEAKNTVDPGSIARGSFVNNLIVTDPNNAPAARSGNNPGHRVFAALTYRKDYFRFGATQVGLFWETANIGNASYRFSNDANGDGGSNDLIYIPMGKDEMVFQQYTQATGVPAPVTFTVQQQQDAWEAYIKQDKYLSANRGKHAERNAILLPMVSKADFSLMQEFHTNFGGTRNAIQFRIDILNVGNLLNKDWGVGQAMITQTPLTAAGVAPDGRLQYKLQNIGGELITKTFRQTAGLGDVYRFQFGVRYVFN